MSLDTASIMSKEILFETRSFRLKCTAFIAVTLSTVAVSACLLAFPMMFHNIQALQAEIDGDVSFCKSRSRDLLKEIIFADEQGSGPPNRSHRSGEQLIEFYRAMGYLSDSDPLFGTDRDGGPRHRRQTYGTQPQHQQSCCTCQRGLPGYPGPPGRSGRDGADGAMGQPGNNGQPAPSANIPDIFPQQCPCEGLTGRPGPGGPKGPSGRPGSDGYPGSPGEPGRNGPPGPSGRPGQPGGPGRKGPPGRPGNSRRAGGPPGRPGTPGRPGSKGRPGNAGRPGNSGKPGKQGYLGGPGQPGGRGNNGRPGFPGNLGRLGPPGSCSHCPSARLAPGY